MKPLIHILLLTVSVTLIEWGVFELMLKNERNKVAAQRRQIINLPMAAPSLSLQRAFSTNVISLPPQRIFITRQKAKAGRHFDGRTAWKE